MIKKYIFFALDKGRVVAFFLLGLGLQGLIYIFTIISAITIIVLSNLFANTPMAAEHFIRPYLYVLFICFTLLPTVFYVPGAFVGFINIIHKLDIKTNKYFLLLNILLLVFNFSFFLFGNDSVKDVINNILKTDYWS